MNYDYKWFKQPAIPFGVESTVVREGNGASENYSGTIKVALGEMRGGNFYRFYIDCTVNGVTKRLKETSATDKQWDAGDYFELWNISGKTVQSTVPVAITMSNDPVNLRPSYTITYNVYIGPIINREPPKVNGVWFITYPYDLEGEERINDYLKGYSRAKVVFDPDQVTVYEGGSIASFSVVMGGVETFADENNVAFTPPLTSAPKQQLLMRVTDDAGNTTESVFTLSGVVDYALPAITNVSAYRSLEDGTADNEGQYISVRANFVVSRIITGQFVEFYCSYSAGGTHFGQSPLDKGTVTVINTGDPIDPTSRVDITITLIDKYNTTTYKAAVAEAFVPFHIKSGGHGAAFGKRAETDDLLEVNYDLKVNGSIEANNAVAEEGSSGSWKWRKWKSGFVEAWYSAGSIGTLTLTENESGVFSHDSIKGVALALPDGVFTGAPKYCAINVTGDRYLCSQVYGVSGTAINWSVWRNYAGDAEISDVQICCAGI